MKHMLVAIGVLGFLCLAPTAARPEEASPGAKLKGFDVWLGDWVVEEQGKDLSSGEQYKIKGEVQIRRLGDHYYVRRFTSEDLSLVVVMGYDPVADSYYSESFASNGLRSSSTIRFGDKKFTDEWTHVTVTGKKLRERCAVDLVASRITFECEGLHDGTWTFSRRGTGTRVK